MTAIPTNNPLNEDTDESACFLTTDALDERMRFMKPFDRGCSCLGGVLECGGGYCGHGVVAQNVKAS